LSVSGVYAARGTASMTATVSNNGSPVPGASVTFTMTKANGTKATQTVTTGSTGKAVWNYRFSGKDPTGPYSVVSNATYNSQTAVSNTVNFTVQ
jgi:hypothetical protein